MQQQINEFGHFFFYGEPKSFLWLSIFFLDVKRPPGNIDFMSLSFSVHEYVQRCPVRSDGNSISSSLDGGIFFLVFPLACHRHPLNGQRMPGFLYHAQSGSSTQEEILQKNVLLYLIENTFDARPTTSFAFHVLFRLRSVARTTAYGFGWRRPVSPKSQLCFRI